MKQLPKYKTILGIETSCDETAAAVVQYSNNEVNLLSNIVSSSLEIQTKYGGVVPEQAAREQLKVIIPVTEEALSQAQVSLDQIDAIAVTEGPGLIGSLLIGVETAKTLSMIYQKPLIRVNHLIAHFYANWINNINKYYFVPTFPILGLLVSGGHTDLIIMKNHGVYEYLGGTRDDASGECFDKSARLLGLPYPGGPQISQKALNGDPKSYPLPRPMLDSGDFDFSFSGLKTAILNQVQTLTQAGKKELTDKQVTDLAASLQEAIVDVLIQKTILAAKEYQIDKIVIAGGVASNPRLREKLEQKLAEKLPNSKLFIPQPKLCTDNAATIATSALFNSNEVSPLNLQANPNLHLSI